MSGRIGKAFRTEAANGKRGFIPFITAGDPDMDATVELVVRLGDLGSTVIELGVPFTDPMADGPVIQRSSPRALERGGADLDSILEAVSKARKRTEVPIVLFGYMNPFLAFGLDRLCESCAQAGVDGLLVTDVVDGEFAKLSGLLAASDLDLISLVAPTTTDERLERIASHARGFMYAVSRTGVTGPGNDFSSSAENLVARLRKVTELPVAVGFGISTADQVSGVQEYADAAVVGSAIVKVIEDSHGAGTLEAVDSFVRTLLKSDTPK